MKLDMQGAQAVTDPLQLTLDAAKQSSESLRVTQLELTFVNRVAKWGAWLKWLLKHAPALLYLDLTSTCSPAFPQMTQLRHLILRIEDPCRNLINPLQQLPALETLLLQGPSHASCRLPDFDLPPSLRHVCLVDLFPARLKLQNAAATIRVEGSVEAIIEGLLWHVVEHENGKLARSIRSAAITAQGMEADHPEEWHLLRLFPEIQQLEFHTPQQLPGQEAPGLLVHSLSHYQYNKLTLLIVKVTTSDSCSCAHSAWNQFHDCY